MWVPSSCTSGGDRLPHQGVGVQKTVPVSLFQAQSPWDLVLCGVVPAQRDLLIPVLAAEPGQLCVSARAGALGHAGPVREAPGELWVLDGEGCAPV